MQYGSPTSFFLVLAAGLDRRSVLHDLSLQWHLLLSLLLASLLKSWSWPSLLILRVVTIWVNVPVLSCVYYHFHAIDHSVLKYANLSVVLLIFKCSNDSRSSHFVHSFSNLFLQLGLLPDAINFWANFLLLTISQKNAMFYNQKDDTLSSPDLSAQMSKLATKAVSTACGDTTVTKVLNLCNVHCAVWGSGCVHCPRVCVTCTVWVKKVAPPKKKSFCNIFTHAKYILVKFCHFLANFYPHIFTNFGQFILQQNFSSSTRRFWYFKFYQVKLPWLHCQWWLVPKSPNSLHCISGLGAMLES